jgi:hypothetical protein
MAEIVNSWSYPSKSGGKPHTTQLFADGLFGCTCKGYYIRRKGKPFCCSHIEDVVKRLGLALETRGDHVYAIAGQDGTAPVGVTALDKRTAAIIESTAAEAEANGYIQPMLASALTDRKLDEPWAISLKPYQDGRYLGQKKYDGERIVCSRTADGVFFWSRPRPGEGTIGLPNKKVGQHIRDAALFLPVGTYDGELIAGQAGKSYDVTNMANRDKQTLVLFDILRVDQDRQLDKPLTKRLEMLGHLIRTVYPGEGHCITLAETVPVTAEELQRLWDAEEEGIIIKLAESVYRPGARGPEWVKLKREFYTAGTITGYEKAKNGPFSKVKLMTAEGVNTTVKTKDNKWLAEFEVNGDTYIGRRLVFKHYGPTPDGKFRGPIIWDHWASDNE